MDIIQILNSNKNKGAKQIDRIQTPEILENHECRYTAQRANNPDTTTIHMITSDLILQYSGERHNEDNWDTPELHMRRIIQARDNNQYALRSEVRYVNMHYAYKTTKKIPINYEQVNKLTN